ncbi:MAG: hypothetical protein ACHQ2Y_04765 [Candidatus Lutacidiplasmatales archaeon]
MKKQSAAKDLCVGCQTPYPDNALFCARCGRPRGAVVTPALTAAPSVVPPFVAAPANPTPAPLPEAAPLPDVDVLNRPAFPEERDQLRRYGSSRTVAVGRVLGLMGGAGAAMLGVEGFMGVPLDPVMYPVLLMVCMMLGIGAAAAARSSRKQAQSALRAGWVTEAGGLVQWGSSYPQGLVGVQLGSARLAVPRRMLSSLVSSAPLKLVWATAGKVQQAPGTGLVRPVVFLSANGSPLAPPRRGYLAL